MLSDRAILLIQMMLNQQHINLKAISKFFNVSERTIRNDLEEINLFLQKWNLPTITKEINTIFRMEASRSKVNEVLIESQNLKDVDFDQWQSPVVRQANIYSNVFIEKERWTIEKFEKDLRVSRSTIINDIKQLRRELKKLSIEIVSDSKRGYLLKGNEINIREYYFNESEVLNINYYNSREYTDSNEEFEFLINWIETIEKKLHKQVSTDGLFKLIFFIKTSIKRGNNGHSLKASYFHQNEALVNKNELITIKEQYKIIEEFYDVELNDYETIYILQKFNQATLLNDELINEGYKVNLDILVNNFVKAMSEKLNLNLYLDKELTKMLALHFQKSILKHNSTKSNIVDEGILNYIKTSHMYYYKAIKNVIETLPEMVSLGFDREEEIAFLTIHMVSTIEKMKNEQKNSIKILVICHLGVGTSQFLKYRLEEYFNFQISTSAKSAFLKGKEDVSSDTDFVISTINLVNLSTPVVHVSPSLNDIDIKNIKKIEDDIVNKKMNKKYSRRYEPLLKDLLTEDMIALNKTAQNWEESIRIGGDILKKKDVVDDTYIDAMIGAVNEFGPYIVIAPGIALAHASSKKGVKKIGMSLITLKEGVEFGSKQNDPVKILVSLAAVDHNTHLKAISELVKLLENETFINTLLNGKKQDVLKMINN